MTSRLSGIIARGRGDTEIIVIDCDLAAAALRSACIRSWHPRLMVECAQDPDPSADLMIDICLAAFAQGVLAQDRPSDKTLSRALVRRSQSLN
jgi:hypothetical protein